MVTFLVFLMVAVVSSFSTFYDNRNRIENVKSFPDFFVIHAQETINIDMTEYFQAPDLSLESEII